MPKGKSSWAGKVLALLAKDLLTEFRTRYALSAIFLFALTTLAAVSFSLGAGGLPAHYSSVLFWVILFFSALSGLAQSFIKEAETRTAVTLQLATGADVVYFGKWVFNLVLLLGLEVFLVPLFLILLNVEVYRWGLLVAITLLGSVGLVSATTLIAAVIATAGVRGALFSVLSLPILLPLLVPLVQVTEYCFLPGADAAGSVEIRILAAYAGVALTGGWLLFPFVWRE
ncbi:heme exporter protein CcmB [Candidatus Zixiibacteriota bacterium]